MLVAKLVSMSNTALSLKRDAEFFVADSPSFGPLQRGTTCSRKGTQSKSIMVLRSEMDENGIMVETKRFHRITKSENNVLMLSAKL